MRIELSRRLSCPPEVAFSLATDPSRMSLWSTARVRSIALGDGRHPAGVGALRDVTLPRGRRRLEEIVETSEPPARFSYRVIGGAPVDRHLGRMEFAPDGDRTTFRWTVEIDFPYPGMASVARRALVPELERSVDALCRSATRAARGTLPPLRRIDADADRASLDAAAVAVRDAQRALADELEAAGDPRHWFTRVYEYVSDAQITACRTNRFDHPIWVLRLVPCFDRYYTENLLRHLHRREGVVEEHWQRAFRRMSSPKKERAYIRMGRGVLHGMKAHIEEDLPRALATTYIEHYSDSSSRGHGCDYARFRADYYRMGFVFAEAAARLRARLGTFSVPLSARLAETFVPARTRDRWMARSYYDIDRRRREAFERGERLVKLLHGEAA